MINIIILIFIITSILALVENNSHRIIWQAIGLLVCTALIITATFREIGADADSLTYQNIFENFDNEYYQEKIEHSFILISQLCNLSGADIRGLFLIYALTAITIKFLAIRKFSEYILLPLVVFISHFFIIHDMIEIRASVATACFLVGLYFQYKDNRKMTCISYIVAAFFHISALAAFVTLLFSNKPLNSQWKVALVALVPLGYIFYFVNSIIPNITIDLPYIGEKIATYQTLLQENTFSEILIFKNPTLLINIMLFYMLIFFHDKILQSAQYIPLMIKVMGISLFLFYFFSFFPIISGRMYEFFSVVNIITFPSLIYATSHKTLFRLFIIFLSAITLYMNLFVYDYLSHLFS